MIKEYYPEAIIHMSVQANILNFRAVDFGASGASRIILPRELTLKILKIFIKKCPVSSWNFCAWRDLYGLQRALSAFNYRPDEIPIRVRVRIVADGNIRFWRRQSDLVSFIQLRKMRMELIL